MTINELIDRNRTNAAEPDFPRNNYASWQEDGVLPEIEGAKIIYKCTPTYKLDVLDFSYRNPNNFTMHAVAGNSCVFRCFLTTPYKIFIICCVSSDTMEFRISFGNIMQQELHSYHIKFTHVIQRHIVQNMDV